MAAALRVLIVDDEPFIAHAVSATLESDGIEVGMCADWTAVATTVRVTDPDLILMDYNMPGLKGDELCRILKRNAVDSHMKIIIFSSEPESDLIGITAQCGADGFLPKNTPVPELVARIRGFVDSPGVDL